MSLPTNTGGRSGQPYPNMKVHDKYANLSIVRKLMMADGGTHTGVRDINRSELNMKGYLFKRGVMSYDVRWFTLTGEDAMLSYYVNEGDPTPRAAIPLFKFKVQRYDEYKARNTKPLGEKESQNENSRSTPPQAASSLQITSESKSIAPLQTPSSIGSPVFGTRPRSAPQLRSGAVEANTPLSPFVSPTTRLNPSSGGASDDPYAVAASPFKSRLSEIVEQAGPLHTGEKDKAKIPTKIYDHLKFVVITPSRTYKFAAPTEAEYDKWMHALRQLSEYQAAIEAEKRQRLARTFDELIGTSKPSQTHVGSPKTARVCASCKKKFNFTRPRAACAECGYHFCANDPRCLSTEDSETKERHCSSCLQVKTHAQLRFHASSANISLEIVEAANIMASDSNGLSDPYCVAYFEGQEFRTQIVDASLNPKFNCSFIIPWIGISKSLAIGVFDFDRYSYDDFLGMVFIPLNELEPDTLYEDWFPLVGRPGKASDQNAGITGHVKLRIVISPNLLATIFTSVWEGVKPRPDDPFSLAQITNQVKRFVGLLQSFQLGWFGTIAGETLRYEHPFRLVCVVVIMLWASFSFPAEYILPSLVFMLLMKLIANAFEARLNEVWYGGVRIRLATNQKQQQHSAYDDDSDDEEDEGKVHSTRKSSRTAEASASSRSGFEDNPDVEKLDEELAPGEQNQNQNQVVVAQQEEEPAGEEEESNVNIFQKYRQVKGTLAGLQNSLRAASDQLERIQNAFSWKNYSLSLMLLVLLTVLMIVLLFIPFRVLVAVLTLHLSTKRLRVLKKMDPPVQEEQNFLERVPTHYDLFANSVSIPKSLLKA